MNTETNKQLLLEQLKKTPIVEAACQKVGVGRSTYYLWRKDDPAFAKEADRAIRDGALLVNDLAESKLIAAVKEGNMSGIMFWLKNNHPSYKARLELEGAIKVIEEMSPEQKSLFKKASELAGMFLNKNSI